MSNEAPTDALRLVPVEPTREQELAMQRALLKDYPKVFEGEAYVNGKLLDGIYAAALAAAPASPLPGGGECSGISGELDRRIKSEMDFIKDIASNVQRDLAELEDGFSKSQSTAKTDRAVAKMRERCAVLIQCADDALAALPAAPTGEPK